MKTYKEFLLEDENYGTKDDLRLDSKSDKIENNFSEDDKKTLEKISGTVVRAINILEELDNFLKSYNKISRKTVEQSLNGLKVFNETLLEQF